MSGIQRDGEGARRRRFEPDFDVVFGAEELVVDLTFGVLPRDRLPSVDVALAGEGVTVDMVEDGREVSGEPKADTFDSEEEFAVGEVLFAGFRAHRLT